MDDWRTRIDAWEAHPAKHRRTQRDRHIVPVQRAALAAAAAPKAHRWGQDASLAAHQRRFRCHICHAPSRGPYTYTTHRLYWISCPDPDDNHGHDGVEYIQHTNWEQPTGLTRCAKCHAWTCLNHVYKGICQTCGTRL
jgi:hypothetical protein